MKDCCGNEIIPIADKLSIHTNRHPNCDRTNWGWIEGCKGNICWSDNHPTFNYERASRFVREYNSRIKGDPKNG